MSKRFSLDHLRSCSIEGPDALAYAQAQFTVSIDTLPGSHWSPLAWCDPKGRVISFMMARKAENGIELVIPAVQAGHVRDKLHQFTIGRQARISETGDVAGTFEPDADTPVLSVDTGRGMRAFCEAQSDAETLGRWQRLDLCRGLPWLEPASSQQHLPQWLGLESLGALAYDKGCYPGQEVIARLHYRGSVKYRLAGIKSDDGVSLTAHSRLFDADGARAGHSLSAMPVGDETTGLAVVSTRIEDGDRVFLHEAERSNSLRVTPPEGLC